MPLCSHMGMWHRTTHPGLSPVPSQGHLGDGRGAVVRLAVLRCQDTVISVSR